MNDNKEFNYSYTAPTLEERKEVDAIKRQYALNQATSFSNIDKLKLLDKKVKRLPKIIFYILLIVGILVSGLGLTFCLEWNNLVIGIIFGTLGIVICLLSFWLKKTIAMYCKKKYGKEILALCDTILNKSNETNDNI